MSEHTPATDGETNVSRGPQIWVGSLADYNAGRLHGRWIDAAQDLADLQADINHMLATAPSPGAEEWGIFDYDGFSPLRLSESEDLDVVSTLAQGISEYGPLFAHWADHVDCDRDRLEHFDQALLGTYPSRTDYVLELLADAGIDPVAVMHLEPWVEPYIFIDTMALARDLEISGEIVFLDHNQQVVVFDGHY